MTRVNPKDPYKHSLLAVKRYKPVDLAKIANIKITCAHVAAEFGPRYLLLRHMWGVLKSLVETCQELEDGKYLLLKDPNDVSFRAFVGCVPHSTFRVAQTILRLYSVPGNAFTNELSLSLADETSMAGAPTPKAT